MLDRKAKKSIDDLRDILVGKVTDPKSQVEHITTALMYKFMSDLDTKSIEMGGKASFFINDMEKYHWKNFFDSKLSGIERVELYENALKEISLAPSFPSLFREIFKGAFLPFKDPSTLKKFLSNLNDFKYENTEVLGNAYEYLLSFMQSQGDAGQFRTPRNIIEFMVQIINPKKDESILDPACGTGGFLLKSYEHILQSNTKSRIGDLLSASDLVKISKNLVGYDIDPEMTRLALVNMHLNQIKSPNIFEYDSISNDDNWNKYSDIVLANPPFFNPKKISITPHSRFRLNTRKAALLFVDYILQHLKPKGRAAIVVPEGIIFDDSAKAFKKLREMLLEEGLIGVISLPANIFKPYSGVKTSVLIIDKIISKEREDIFIGVAENDGFSLNDKREPINENDLPNILNDIQNYYKNSQTKKSDKFLIVKKQEILSQKYFSFEFNKYAEQDELISNYPIVNLIDLYQLISPTSKIKNKDYLSEGQIPVVDQSEKFIAGYWSKEEDMTNISSPVVIFGDHTRVVKYVDFDFVAGADGIKILKPNPEVLPRFLFYLIKNLELPNLGYSRHYKELKIKKVPLPPLEDQQEIVDELEDYQKVIDGCKQVIENYKPTIDIDPSWDMVELGNISSMQYGLGESAADEGEYRFIRISDIDESGLLKDTDKKYIDINNTDQKYILSRGEILMARTGATYGKCLYFEGKEKSVYAGYLIKISLDNKKIINRFFWYFTQSYLFQKQKEKLVTGGGQPQFNANTIKMLNVPLPPLSIQEELISKIEEERKVIEGNTNLVEIYTQKIQDRINKVWGED